MVQYSYIMQEVKKMFVYFNTGAEDVVNTDFIVNFWKDHENYDDGVVDYNICLRLKNRKKKEVLYFDSEEERDTAFQKLIDLLEVTKL
ncbi:MAG TPA: hypothetical protein DCO72_00475 [Ruminococcus sp.]|nr:hypothetical protein [Ruminococcus sp.]